jgi:1-acyl-sn-glycerol-3-phosphate acyltransferase
MEFLPRMLRVLAQSPQGRVEIVFHPELRVADYADRKALAKACETLVRQGVEARLTKPV